jgi:hypothetical protein
VFKLTALLILYSPILSYAETPFAGTWVAQPELTAYSLRPLSFMIEGGTYKRTSCVPTPEVRTDGNEHDVLGDPFVQSMSVRLLDANRVEVAQKVAGRLVWKGIYTVGKDGNSMVLKYDDHRPSNTVSGTIQYARDGAAIPNAHLLSGTWKPEKLLDISPSALSMTIKDTDQGLNLTASDGRAFDIKFDRRDYPLGGYLDGATVQVGLRTPQLLQINRKQQGVLVEMTIAPISPDGQTLLFGQLDEQCQSKVTWSMSKQPSR